MPRLARRKQSEHPIDNRRLIANSGYRIPAKDASGPVRSGCRIVFRAESDKLPSWGVRDRWACGELAAAIFGPGGLTEGSMRFRLIDTLERWFGRFAFPHLTLALILAQVAAFLLGMENPGLFQRLVLVPRAVWGGEYWRLVTVLAVPPTDNLLFAFFFWYFLYFMGAALEQYWGAFRYNLFLLVGYLATVAVAFLTPEAIVTNGFLFGSVFLAFAYLNPEFVIYLFFLLPVKIKWLAIFTWGIYGLNFFVGSWETRLAVLASIANFALFFGPEILVRARTGRRRMAQQAQQAGRQSEPFHRCRVCGITDKSHPGTEFRYCSQCVGAYGYCPDHIRNHEHVTDQPPNGAPDTRE